MSIPYTFSASTLSNVKEINSSFAFGDLKVCYAGKNRNGSRIEKSSIVAALPSLRNVPIVCHWKYDSGDSGEIGGHDVELAKYNNGESFIRVLTEPCGVVPESATFDFQIENIDGKEVDTLVIHNVILWKRQNSCEYIINNLDGKVDQSMEINVIDCQKDSQGCFNITDFEFTALCLLESDKPCFENAGLELFSLDDFKLQFEEMKRELKELNINQFATSIEDVNIHQQKLEEGGQTVLEKKMALLAKYNIAKEDLEFSIDEFSLEELETKLVEIVEAQTEDNPQDSEEPESNPEELPVEDTQEQEVVEAPQDETAQGEEIDVADAPEVCDGEGEATPTASAEPTESFALNSQVEREIIDALLCGGECEIECYDGTSFKAPKYIFSDFDLDALMIYCLDREDWIPYGFAFRFNGDKVVIDFESKRRVKICYTDYDEGEESVTGSFSKAFEQVIKEYQETSNIKISDMNQEIETLRAFKLEVEHEKLENEINAVFEKFTDLNGIEEFELLKSEHTNYSLDTLEEKCYAIRGKNGVAANFSLSQGTQKILIDRKNTNDNGYEPYGGIFKRRGIVE